MYSFLPLGLLYHEFAAIKWSHVFHVKAVKIVFIHIQVFSGKQNIA